MLSVSHRARAIGWINKLIVSIITSIGIRGVGAPGDRKRPTDAFGLGQKPVITVPAHKGTTVPKAIESCVGVQMSSVRGLVSLLANE